MSKPDEYARNYFPNRGPIPAGKNGELWFRRRVDGAVEIWLGGRYDEAYNWIPDRKEPVAILPANHWASIVTTLTTPGETGFTFGLFMAFHNGGNAYDPEAYQHQANQEPMR